MKAHGQPRRPAGRAGPVPPRPRGAPVAPATGPGGTGAGAAGAGCAAPPKYQPRFSEEALEKARQIVRVHTAPHSRVQRARLALLLAEHPSISSVEAGILIGWHPQTVLSSHWPASDPVDHGRPLSRFSAAEIVRTAVKQGILSMISPTTVREWFRSWRSNPGTTVLGSPFGTRSLRSRPGVCWTFRGTVTGRVEAKTGIMPFRVLVRQVMRRKRFRSARRVFWIVDNSSSHRPGTFGA